MGTSVDELMEDHGVSSFSQVYAWMNKPSIAAGQAASQ
jgi:hypothetical protein